MLSLCFTDQKVHVLAKILSWQRPSFCMENRCDMKLQILFERLRSLAISREVLLYGLIGLANTAIHFCVLWAIYLCGGSQAIGNLCGFLIAVLFSFLMNSKFTFKKKPTVKKFLKMVAVMSGLSYGSGLAGDLLSIHPIITFVGYSAISYVVGFILTKKFVFSE